MNRELFIQYQSIQKEAAEINDRINEVYSAALYPKSPQMTGTPRASGYSNDGMFRIFEQIEELTTLYRKKQVQLNDLCLEIEREIEGLESLERRIIRLRYLSGKSWTEISEAMGYSVAQLHRIHKKIFAK